MAIKIQYHRKFLKSYRSRILPYPSLVRRLRLRVDMFSHNSANPILRDHRLAGEMEGYRSFSISGDIRIIYKRITLDSVIFVDVGSHNQVYG